MVILPMSPQVYKASDSMVQDYAPYCFMFKQDTVDLYKMVDVMFQCLVNHFWLYWYCSIVLLHVFNNAASFLKKKGNAIGTKVLWNMDKSALREGGKGCQGGTNSYTCLGRVRQLSRHACVTLRGSTVIPLLLHYSDWVWCQEACSEAWVRICLPSGPWSPIPQTSTIPS